jgi:hypothetical protein
MGSLANITLRLGLWLGRLFGRVPRVAVSVAKNMRAPMTVDNAERVVDMASQLPPEVIDKAMVAIGAQRTKQDPSKYAVTRDASGEIILRVETPIEHAAIGERNGVIVPVAESSPWEAAAAQADADAAAADVDDLFAVHEEDEAALGAEAASAF